MQFFNVFNRKEKLLLAALSIVQFNHIVDFMILMPLGPTLMRFFSITPEQFSNLVSAYTFSAGISGILISTIIDRFDRKHALLFFFSGFAVSTIFCGMAKSYEALLFARLLAGFFGGVIASLAIAIASDAIGPDRRATALGTLATSFSIASIFGVPLSLLLATEYNWHTPFFFLGFLSLFVWVFIWFIIPNMKGHLQNQRKESFLTPFKNLFIDSRQLSTALFNVCLIMSAFTLIPFISPSFVANGGMQENDLFLVYLLGGICSIITAPLVGRYADENGKLKVFQAAALLNIIPILFITELQRNPIFVLLAISCLFFITMSARMVPAQAMISSAVTSQHRASFMSLISSIQNFSMSFAAYLSGKIIVKSESGELLHYNTVGYIAVGFTLLSLFFARRMRPAEGTSR